MNALVLVLSKKLFKAGIAVVFHPRLSGVVACQVMLPTGGKYMAELLSGGRSFFLQAANNMTNKILMST
jgi:hypothetical protein